MVDNDLEQYIGGITIWGKMGRDGSRHIQLGVTIFHLCYHTPVLVYALYYPAWVLNPSTFQWLCKGGIISGWVALPIFVGQIFCARRCCTNNSVPTPPANDPAETSDPAETNDSTETSNPAEAKNPAETNNSSVTNETS